MEAPWTPRSSCLREAPGWHTAQSGTVRGICPWSLQTWWKRGLPSSPRPRFESIAWFSKTDGAEPVVRQGVPRHQNLWSGVGDEAHLCRVRHTVVLWQDPHGVAEDAGAAQHEVALEAVPAILVGLGEAQRRRLDVPQGVGFIGATVHQLNVDIVRCQIAQGHERAHMKSVSDLRRVRNT